MDGFEFHPHALEEMASDSIAEEEAYHVIGDADEAIERFDGRTEYARMLQQIS